MTTLLRLLTPRARRPVTTPRLSVTLTHFDPVARRRMELLVAGPAPVDVLGVTLYGDQGGVDYFMSAEEGSLAPAAAEALTREFAARLKCDQGLREWLAAEYDAARGRERA